MGGGGGPSHSGSPKKLDRVRQDPTLTQQITADEVRPVVCLDLQGEKVISGEQIVGTLDGKAGRAVATAWSITFNIETSGSQPRDNPPHHFWLSQL